ncbi:glycosyltransferase family 2 protein [Bacteroides oleiciplenus]|nr:glycosyltransferase [Bacteroides oleiciplenus]
MAELSRKCGMPLVSIIVPVYNMENSIDASVKNLVTQDYPNTEIILVDDGSTDDSLKRCLGLAQEYSCVKVIHSENKGSGPARNAGIEIARGHYAYFPDADDLLDTNAIAIMVQAMITIEGCDLVVFGFWSKNIKGRILSVQRYSDSVQHGNKIRNSYSNYMTTFSQWGIQGAPWNKLFDLNVIKNNHIVFPSLRRHQDEGFIARYMCVAKKVHFIKDVLYTYFVNDLKKEWQKYPVDYLDAVIGLNNIRKETILTWNPNDILTHNMVQREYICNVIKSLELSFSPKMALVTKSRKIWINQAISKSSIGDVEIPLILGWYQKIIMKIIIHNKILLYYALKVKVLVEKYYPFNEVFLSINKMWLTLKNDI